MSNHLPVTARSLNLSPSIAAKREVRPFSTDIISEIYKHSVPDFASKALDRLQGSLYASARYLQLSDSDRTPPNTWVGYRSGEIISVLLFRINHKSVNVLCEVVTIDASQIDAFAACVFSNFSGIRHISFNAVSVSQPPCSLPSQYFAFSENYVLTLPASTEAYMAMLGKSTRQSVRGYRNRLLRDFPDFSWTSYTCDELTIEQQRQLVLTLQQFKRDSMTARGKSPVIDEVETQHFLMMATECGLFGIARVNGRICAGAFSCRVGDSYVMLLSASDPAMSLYRLGLLTCLWSVGDCISRGGRQCHLLWGRYQYKHQLLAVPKALYRLTVYPSFLQMLGQPFTVLRMYFGGCYVHILQFLQSHLQSEKNPAWRWLYYRLRYLKKMSGAMRKKFISMRERNRHRAQDSDPTPGRIESKDRDSAIDFSATANSSRRPIRAP